MLSVQHGDDDGEAALDRRASTDSFEGGGRSSKASGGDPWWARWWVLGWYSYLSALQSLIWMTWSSVPDISKAYLSTDDSTLDLWLDWGPTAYCVSVFAALWLLSARLDGLRLSVRVAAMMCFAAALFRCVPLLFSEEDRAGDAHGALLAVIHAAQFLNGAVAPFVVASPSHLSLLWFSDAQRNTATAVANVANALGRAVGFFLGPAVVASTTDLPTLLLLEVALAGLPLVATLIYYPAVPANPPSAAAAQVISTLQERRAWAEARAAAAEEGEEAEAHGAYAGLLSDSDATIKAHGSSSGSSTFITAAREIGVALRQPSFLILAIAGGAQMAWYGAWSGVLPTVLTPRFTDAQAGSFGSVNTFAGIVGGLLAGLITDHPRLRKQLGLVVQVLALASAALFAVLALAVPPYSQLPQLSYGALLALCGAAGLLRGGTDPLFFELSAEAVYPAGVPAGTAGGVLTFWYHILLVATLSMPSDTLTRISMAGMGAVLAASALLMLAVRVQYTRR